MNQIEEWVISGQKFWAGHPDTQGQKQKVLFCKRADSPESSGTIECYMWCDTV